MRMENNEYYLTFKIKVRGDKAVTVLVLSDAKSVINHIQD